ncbi:Trypsin Inhibitor-like, cysteine rich domain-containing protein [Strongyloides ratti]|uniref:Trypsin Inhibitor-like, cysteine rich domain-containing protein n=1 Tax=Strongyloides ratti TaxID=34506 RepID=A0A090L8A0_STRRB|nr:Trypsin Inhibitor-like, cysteine rich domain-containing protein [Strongyloides ratti]CEF64348.1 Trypsin Inhibitor-like, cysteine rich domain-containing protein [Strongyloides ratti]
MKLNHIIYLIILFVNLSYQARMMNKVCPQNATWSDCTPKCYKTCEKPNRVCQKDCNKPGCVCKNSYVVKDKTNCVLKDDCPNVVRTTKLNIITTTTIPIPKECFGNKTLVANMPTCTPKCPGLPKDLCTTDILPPGCACIPPYATNAEGNCILRTDCPLRSYPTTTPTPPNPCKAPWLLVECRSACPPTCSESRQSDCLRFCLPKGCACVDPYALTSKGECVRRSECPRESNNISKEKDIVKNAECPENMEYVSGKDSCERKCGVPANYSTCMKVSRGSTCECRYPFALNKNNQCVHESQC